LWGDCSASCAELIRDGERLRTGHTEYACAARGKHNTLDKRWAKEPAGEREPCGGGNEVLDDAVDGTNRGRARKECESKSSRSPTPSLLYEYLVEWVGFSGEVMSCLERVREVCEDWI
jgi:hypothetical protein